MDLYLRLLDEGLFAFWNDNDEKHTYTLTISLYNGGVKIPIVKKSLEAGVRYFSLSPLGSGEYEIELNGYDGDRLFQTEVKKSTLKSSSQKTQELMDTLKNITSSIENVDMSISGIIRETSLVSSALDNIESMLRSPNNLDISVYARIIKNIKDWMKFGY